MKHTRTIKLITGIILIFFAGIHPAFAQDHFKKENRQVSSDDPRVFRLAFSYSLFSEVNEADARAAMKAWIMTVAREHGILVDPNPNIFMTVDELLQFAESRPMDGFGITLPEYRQMSRTIPFSRFALGVTNGRTTETYLLLVRSDSKLEGLEQLRSRSLNVLHNPRMSLALIWLETLLMEAGLGLSGDWFEPVVLNKNPSQVILPVFFGKAAACLINRAAFEVMGELNPQLNAQLRVLAESPEVVPSGFAFRDDLSSSHHAQLLEAMEGLGETPAGRQILTLTQSDRIEVHPVSVLDPGLDLIARHARLLDKAGAGNKDPSSIPLPKRSE